VLVVFVDGGEGRKGGREREGEKGRERRNQCSGAKREAERTVDLPALSRPSNRIFYIKFNRCLEVFKR
jgi:hypothetical protein